MEDTKDRMQPCHQPKRLALLRVMKKAGSGAIRDWKIISRADTSMAQGPYWAIKARMAEKSPVRNITSTLLIKLLTPGTSR